MAVHSSSVVWLGAATIAALAASTAPAQAQIPSAAGVYTACVRFDRDGDEGKLVRVIDPTRETCRRNEALVTWNAKGQKGDTGPAGPAGPAGAPGVTGAPGATGPKGDTGAAGAPGPAGPKGDAGALGAQGPVGPAGAKGDAGATGAAGAQGPAGPQGPKGDAGAAGLDGLAGAARAAGPQGPAGPTGPQGPAGSGGIAGIASLGDGAVYSTFPGVGTSGWLFLSSASPSVTVSSASQKIVISSSLTLRGAFSGSLLLASACLQGAAGTVILLGTNVTNTPDNLTTAIQVATLPVSAVASVPPGTYHVGICPYAYTDWSMLGYFTSGWVMVMN